MKCPYCHFEDTQVTDSRVSTDGDAVKRRRQCKRCERRFTTYERIERMGLTIVKRDGSREPFSREKLRRGLTLAVTKRKVPADRIEDAVNSIETGLYSLGSSEVPTEAIGELVMQRLRERDEVAYIRFASVYRNFADLEEMREEMEGLGAHPPAEEIAGHISPSDDSGETRKRGKRNGTK
jgi:transcriptional repressor NrdR